MVSNLTRDEALKEAARRELERRRGQTQQPVINERMPLHPEFDPANVPSQSPTMDKVGAFLTSALEGIPIVGPSFSNVALDTSAGLGSMISGEPATNVRAEMLANAKRAQGENPGSSFAGSAAGTIGPLAALGATELGAKLFGITGDSLLSRSILSGATNAGINVADTAARGGGDQDAARSGLIGLGLGAALPGAGALLNAGGRAVGEAVGPRIRAITSPESEAVRRVGRALEVDQRNINGVPVLSQSDELAAITNGQPILNVDRGGEASRALARSAANNDPEARALIDRTTSDRFTSQGPRAVGFVDKLMGGNVDDLALQEQLKTAARKANSPAYKKAYAEGAEGVITPELERLAGSPAVAQAMKAAAMKGQDRAIVDGFGAFKPKVTFTPDGRVQFRNGGGVPTYPDMQFWDYTYRELRDAGMAARRQGRNGEAETIGNLAVTLRGELDKAVPSYAAARQGAASFFGAEDALDAGRKFVSLSKSIPETRQALAKMTQAERDAFATGFASELKDTITSVRDRSNVIDRIYGSEEARQKIALALGPQKAQQFEAFVRVENIMDKLRGAMGNSTTARQLKELGMAGAAGAGVGYATGDWKSGITTALLVRGARAYGAKVDESMAKGIANMLLSDDPQKLKMAVAVASRNPKAMQVLTGMQKFIAANMPAVAVGASRAGVEN